MSKLTAVLVDLAARHARKVLVDCHRSLMPTWVLINDRNRIMLIGTPWKDALEKRLYARSMRKEIRRRRIVAYSFVTEAWKTTVSSADLTVVRPSERPDRTEIVMALASDGNDQEFKTWMIQRDWNEQVTSLSPLPHREGTPEGWMFDLLRKRNVTSRK